MKIETHLHIKGTSRCATSPIEKIIETYKNCNYDGIVVTNHIKKVYFDEYAGNTFKEKLDCWFSFIDEMKKQGEMAGLKIFYGAETNVLVKDEGKYAEYMLYGFDRKFLYDNKPTYLMMQEELFKLVDGTGILMYQTHPYRINVERGNPKFMHGAEAINGHFHHQSFNKLASDFCDENKLIKMAGSDYHHEGQIPTCATFFDDNIEDEKQLTKAIFEGKYTYVFDESTYERERKKALEG